MGAGKFRATGLPLGTGRERLARPNRTDVVLDRAIGNKLADTAIGHIEYGILRSP